MNLATGLHAYVGKLTGIASPCMQQCHNDLYSHMFILGLLSYSSVKVHLTVHINVNIF